MLSLSLSLSRQARERKKLRNFLCSGAGIPIHGRSRSTYLDSEVLTSASVDSLACQPAVGPSALRSLLHTPVLCVPAGRALIGCLTALPPRLSSSRSSPALVGEESLATQSAALFKEAGFAMNLILKRSWRPPYTRLAFSRSHLYSFC